MDYKVYWAGIEYKYNKASSTKAILEGGFVYIFVKAFDAREVLERLLIELKKKVLTLIEVEFISPYDIEMEWELEKEKKHYLELYNNALKTDLVVFDDFYAYES